jgi:opacity protein-like surface antigen
LGRIGAQVGFSVGPAWHPFGVGQGVQATGFADLPLAQGFGGRLSYRIDVTLASGESAPFTITDPIAFVANLAAGADQASALAGPPRAPFPVRRQVRTRARLLVVSPFALRHTFTGLDRLRLRPYLLAGVDAVVTITKQVPVADESLIFTGTGPFDDALIGGLVAQAPELAARGLPTGQGNIDFGYHAGAGLEIRLSRGVSLALDYRLTRFDNRHTLQGLGAGLGVHW